MGGVQGGRVAGEKRRPKRARLRYRIAARDVRKRIQPSSRQWYDIIHEAIALARRRKPGEREQAVYIEDLAGRTPERVAGSVTDFALRRHDVVPPGFKIKTRIVKHQKRGHGQEIIEMVEVRAVRVEGE